jgi:hypothetical protein
VLSGGDGDAAVGLWALKEHGGIALVQHPAFASAPGMPRSAIAADHPDAVLTVAETARQDIVLCSRNGIILPKQNGLTMSVHRQYSAFSSGMNQALSNCSKQASEQWRQPA